MPSERFLEGAMRLVTRVSEALAMVSLALLVLLFVVVIALRPFGISIPSADEFASMGLAGTLTLGLAAAVGYNEHVEIRFIVDALSVRVRSALGVMAIVVSILVVGLVLYGTANLWFEAAMRGTMLLGTLPIPRAIPLGIVVIGLLLFEIALILRLLGFRAGRFPAIAEKVEHFHGS